MGEVFTTLVKRPLGEDGERTEKDRGFGAIRVVASDLLRVGVRDVGPGPFPL